MQVSSAEEQALADHIRRTGLRPAEVARRVGCSAAHLSQVISGKRRSRALAGKIMAIPTREQAA